MPLVLMVFDRIESLDNEGWHSHPTGFGVEEFTRPHKMLSDAGLEVSIATPTNANCSPR